MVNEAESAPRPVLVATDLSDPSGAAISCAHVRARAAGAPLVVLHVIDYIPSLPPLSPGAADALPPALAEHQSRLARLLGERVEQLTGRRSDGFQVRVEFGRPYATIIQRAEQLDVAQIVVASRGASGVGRLVLGSVAERVVRHAHCPVLVMRPGNDTGPVLAATDLSDAALPAVEAAAQEARTRNLPLAVLHDLDTVPWLASAMAPLGPVPLAPAPETIDKVRAAAAEVLDSAMRRIGVEGSQLVTTEGNPVAAILRTAEARDASIIVVGTRGRTGLARLALGSVAESVIRHSHCSVLAVRVS